ncbi:MAG: T9SS type A sorting domain-containing protein, partial [Cryomorphaceae bacterium]
AGNADTSFAAVCFAKCYDCAVSIDEALGNISLYPNPTAGAFTLERSELAGDIQVSIIGLQGQLLINTEWTAGQSELNINLSDLAAGVYMVRLTAEEGTRTLRVAVQR